MQIDWRFSTFNQDTQKHRLNVPILIYTVHYYFFFSSEKFGLNKDDGEISSIFHPGTSIHFIFRFPGTKLLQ